MGNDAKVQIIFVAFQTIRQSNGGVESATRIFEALADDFRWTLLTNRETERTKRWRARGARVVRFAFDEETGAVARRLRLGVASVKAIALGGRGDILHGNDIRAAQLLHPVARLTGGRLALTLRDTKPPEERYGPNWHRVARGLDALVTLSDDMARLVGDRLPVDPSRRYTINSIVDLERFHPLALAERTTLRARLGVGPGEVALGMVAGVFDKKRQLEVLRNVLPQLADLPIRLHFVGDFAPESDAYSRACAEAVAAGGLTGRVTFHGFRPDVADWLAALDIVLVASRREGLARCMIEAMACGTPVVSFDISSAREMLEATGAGLVVTQDDWDGLVASLRRLAADPGARQAMSRAGRAAAEARFSVERVAAAWHNLYTSLAARKTELRAT